LIQRLTLASRIFLSTMPFIRAGRRHRLKKPGVIDLVLIEVPSGDYLGEDDIVRFNDAYGRAGQ
jgi:mannose-1-phosphate guanylyltransferase